MWKWLTSLFQRRPNGTPAGVVTRDASIDVAVEKVLRAVALQLAAAQPTPDQIRANWSAILGYVATLAEAESRQFTSRDQRGAGALIAMLAAAKLLGASADHGELLSEFSSLEQAGDYGYRQGGALALKDREAEVNGSLPSSLALWMKNSIRSH